MPAGLILVFCGLISLEPATHVADEVYAYSLLFILEGLIFGFVAWLFWHTFDRARRRSQKRRYTVAEEISNGG
jgi:peptidoglycan/LPS O-acetylase OafA/YrhL